MKKEVKFEVILKNNSAGQPDIFIQNRQNILLECLSVFGKPENPIELSGLIKTKQKKQSKLLAYFYAEVMPKMIYGFVDAGYYDMNEEVAYIFLCKKFLGTEEIANHKTGEVIEKIKTLSDVDDEQKRVFVNKCIIFAGSELHVRIQSPEQYKQNQQQFHG